MKYIVNTRTKEHRVHTDEYFEDADVWRIVEADADGWIPWNGGECPLPDGHAYNFATECAPGKRAGEIYREPEKNYWGKEAGSLNIIAYLPILAEKEEPRRHGRTIVHIPESQQSVFDRLKSAIAASESIPDIIAEIDALLPEGYCVVKRGDVNEAHIEGIGGVTLTSQPAEDMSDWRNWREGDRVEAIQSSGRGYVKGTVYTISAIDNGVVDTVMDSQGYDDNGWGAQFFRFHSRPAKVTK